MNVHRPFATQLRLLCGMLAFAVIPCALDAIKPANSDLLELERFSAPNPENLRDLNDLSSPPTARSQVRPEFPSHLRVATVGAEVLVGFIVNSSGDVSHAYAIRSNNPWFERGSVEAVKQWRFDPGRVNGHAVNTKLQVPIMFSLEAPKAAAWTLRLLTDTTKLPEQFRYDEPPRVRATTFAVYPYESLLANRAAKVSFRALVDSDGKVAQIVFTDAPDEPFSGGARAMIDHWQFKPASLAGKSVPTVVLMELTFSTKGASCAPIPESAKAILKELKRKAPDFYVVSDLDAAPRVIAHHLPVHPPALREAGVAGRALIEMFIDEEGNVQLPRIVEATHPEFGYAAAQAVATWWFEPPLRNGRPVTVRTRVPVVFEVKDSAEP